MNDREVQKVYLIAICDDELAEIKKTQNMLSDYREKHLREVYPEMDIDTEDFTDAGELIGKIRDEDYSPDLILMDIYMQSGMGIDAARELRDMGNKSKIVFLTTSREHALDAFRVDAAQYLTKPVEVEELYRILDNILVEAAAKDRKYVVVQAEKKLRRVAVQDILYCEAQRKSQNLHLADGTKLHLHMSMVGLEEMFSPFPEIVRVGKSYLINLSHVESFDGPQLQMDEGSTLFIPKTSSQFLKDRYFSYYCDREDM